jgi:two-component system chemotaxis sensor kinase CheA
VGGGMASLAGWMVRTNGLGVLPDKRDVDNLTKEFLAESQEGLDRMEVCLTELEAWPRDEGLVDEIFRCVHTIKGTTGFLGFDRLERLAHTGEHLLASLRDGTVQVTTDLISGLLRLVDGLRTILTLVEETGSEGTRVGDEDGELIAELRGLNGRMPWGDAEARREIAEIAGEAGQQGSEAASDVASRAFHGHLGDQTLRIDVSVLNWMMNLVGELVLTRNQILQGGLDQETFPELALRLDSVTADLRETVMQARMQPVGTLFGKFPRMVRDLARTCGRSVRVEFSGEETGLDKGLLEAIKDPLTHAVRNAVDHGIEDPGARVLAGKPADGCVRLKAFHQSGSVVIEVSDDGAGIAPERVLAKAVERRLVTAEQAATMSEREALELILLPGFSTVNAVTTISGRGVGMDVVRANVERVGGSVEIESLVGVGTTLRLRVPLTLAIIPSLVVRSGGRRFVLPQSALVELVDLPKEQAMGRIGSAEVYRLRERLLPVVWLDRLLGLERCEKTDNRYLAVLEAEGCRYGLVVDELMMPEEIVVKPLSAVLREIRVFSGATVLGNGTLALILDVSAVGARAGVKPVQGEMTESVAVEQDGAMDRSFLIFEGRRRERMALPLHVVERIESVPLTRIEYAGGRALLRYGEELLPLRDDGKVLAELEAEQTEAREAFVTVLICGEEDSRGDSRGRRHFGMVVRRVFDVLPGTLMGPDAAIDGTELVLVKERLTAVYHEFEAKDAAAELQEVA